MRRRLMALMESYIHPAAIGHLGFLHRSLSWLTGLLDPNDWLHLQRGAEGPVLVPLTVSKGVRVGTRELIRDAMRRMPDRLTVKLHAFATKVVLEDGNRATGIEFLDKAHAYRADPYPAQDQAVEDLRRTVRARHEVILAGGTFNTPQLLMLSGIGPPEELSKHGIGTRIPLPGIGKNLQDRYEIGIVHEMREPFAILKHADLRPGDREFADWQNGHGLYTANGVVAAIVKRSSLAQPDPDLFLFAIPGHFSGYKPGYSEWGRKKNYFTWVILKAHTQNRAGRLCLRTSDPCDPPCINFHYFNEGTNGHQDDVDGVVAGIEFVRKITGRTASLFKETIPGPQVHSRAELAQFVMHNAWGHHACGTCKIGADDDEDAVLDSEFRVRKTRGLRVVDASIFPKIPGFFILSAILMAAEKASKAIISDARRNSRTYP